MNQSRDSRNLKETTGSSLVMLVNKIHIKKNDIEIVTGCFNILISYFPSYNNLIIKNISTPNIKGSVGKDIPIPKSKALTLIAMGVKKVIRRMILSSEIKYSKRINIITGSNAPQ